MTYDYVSNEVIDFGGQGFMGRIIADPTEPRGPPPWGGASSVHADRCRSFRLLRHRGGRDYDYGVGIGAKLNGSAIYKGVGLATLRRIPLVAGGEQLAVTITTSPSPGSARLLQGQVRRRPGYTGTGAAALRSSEMWTVMSPSSGVLSLTIPSGNNEPFIPTDGAWRAGALTLLIGCLDSIVQEKGPENDPQVTNTASSFEFKAGHGKRQRRADFQLGQFRPTGGLSHNSFIHHGWDCDHHGWSGVEWTRRCSSWIWTPRRWGRRATGPSG